MPYKKISDLNMYYEEFGKGETVIFLHSSFSRGILAFGAQILPFQAKYHVYIPDFRGHGRSISDSLYWDSSVLADDIINFMDAEKIEKAHLIGYSLGGGVAYYIASKHPERVLSVISIGNGGVIDDEGSVDYEPENLLKNKENEFIDTMIERHFDSHRGNWQEYMRMEVKDWRSHPQLSDEEWSQIIAPMLLIAGEKDTFANEKLLNNIKNKTPKTKIYIVKDAGHGPHFVTENAKEINDLMLDFLKNNSYS